jgi:hypothetical protein
MITPTTNFEYKIFQKHGNDCEFPTIKIFEWTTTEAHETHNTKQMLPS